MVGRGSGHVCDWRSAQSVRTNAARSWLRAVVLRHWFRAHEYTDRGGTAGWAISERADAADCDRVSGDASRAAPAQDAGEAHLWAAGGCLSGVLGLFPSLSGIGGVEGAGRIAWNAAASVAGGEAHVFCYGAPVSHQDVGSGTVHHAGTQAMAVIRASSRKWPVRLILVWHIGMLKLLPFVRARGARVALFLLGFVAWRRPSPATARLLRNVDLFLTNSDFTWTRFLEFHPEWGGAVHR